MDEEAQELGSSMTSSVLAKTRDSPAGLSCLVLTPVRPSTRTGSPFRRASFLSNDLRF